MPLGVFPHCEVCGARVQQWSVRMCLRCQMAETKTKEVRGAP